MIFSVMDQNEKNWKKSISTGVSLQFDILGQELKPAVTEKSEFDQRHFLLYLASLEYSDY